MKKMNGREVKNMKDKKEISVRSGKILTFSLPAVTAALAYILAYSLHGGADLGLAMRMTEFSLGALVLCMTSAFMVDMREKRKE